MKGLMKNEFLTMRRMIALYAAVFVVYYLLGVFGTAMSGVQIFGVFFATMLVISSFSYEEKSGWNIYVNVLPVSGGQIVLSKYLFALTCTAVAALFGVLIQCGLNLKNGNPVFQDIWVAGAAVMIAVVFLSAALPVLFKVGAEKSRVILLLLFMIPFAVVLVVEKTGMEFQFSLDGLLAMYPALGLLAAAVLLVSCAVSMEIYKRKEF